MVFEVRNRNYEQMVSNLPALGSEEGNEPETIPEIALPKVVLEDAPPEKTQSVPVKNKFLSKKIAVIATLVLAAGMGLYFKYEIDKEKKKQLVKNKRVKNWRNKLDVFYKEALANKEKSRYQLCIDQLEELRKNVPEGYFDNSKQQLFLDCQNGLTGQRQKEEYMAQEKIKKETEEKIKKIAEECKKQFDEKKIQTIVELNECAAELIGGLDPENALISAIRAEIEEKETLRLLKEQKRAAYRESLQRKKALYNKARRIRDQNKPLKAVSAYNVFLKSARGISSLQNLYTQAETERDEIQQKYDGTLNGLYESCENLIQKNKMKEAYSDCKKILEFKSDDKKAKQFIQQALSTIRRELKPLYEQSMLDESFSRIEEAKKLWNEILKKDVSDGHYYKKAVFQLNKYK